MSRNLPAVVVVGICGHGLSITRMLRGEGFRVYALESNFALPGVKTNSAEIITVSTLSGAAFIEELLGCVDQIDSSGKPILLLTNDNMVKDVAANIAIVSKRYRVSWADCAVEILSLMNKSGISQRTKTCGLKYPTSMILKEKSDIPKVSAQLRYPIIFKPDAPLSEFKTLLAYGDEELFRQAEQLERALPVIAQEFVPGGDDCIYFCAMYLKKGKIIAHFEGRKLRSRPMGHTTIAVGASDSRVFASARRFFEGLDLSGPVSLELKVSPNKEYFVIEPTVGRTDFWIGLGIAEKVNLPLIECLDMAENDVKEEIQTGNGLWINEERDPAGLGWLLFSAPRILLSRRKVLLFFDKDDFKPFYRWILIRLFALPERIIQHLQSRW
jgi:D-aspartate ligase